MLKKLPYAHRPDVVDHVQRDEGFARFHASGITSEGTRGKCFLVAARLTTVATSTGAHRALLEQSSLRLLFFQRVSEALGAMAAEGRTIDGKAVTEAALAGDPASIAVFDLVGSRLGVALTSFANIFEPEVFVIGGGVIAAGDLLLEPARRELRARALPPMKDTPVVAAEMGEDAGMIGAAAMARIELDEGRVG